MRLFWAVELPDPVRAALAEVQAQLRRACPDEKVSWSRPEQLHLTLKFLGELPRRTTPETIVAAAKPLLPESNLGLELTRLGQFGGRSPRVLWASVEGPGLQRLVELADALDRAMRPLGFRREKRGFQPHVTLGRVRKPQRPSGLPGALASLQVEPKAFTVPELVLLSSSYGEQPGPVTYTAAARLGFQLTDSTDSVDSR